MGDDSDGKYPAAIAPTGSPDGKEPTALATADADGKKELGALATNADPDRRPPTLVVVAYGPSGSSSAAETDLSAQAALASLRAKRRTLTTTTAVAKAVLNDSEAAVGAQREEKIATDAARAEQAAEFGEGATMRCEDAAARAHAAAMARESAFDSEKTAMRAAAEAEKAALRATHAREKLALQRDAGSAAEAAAAERDAARAAAESASMRGEDGAARAHAAALGRVAALNGDKVRRVASYLSIRSTAARAPHQLNRAFLCAFLGNSVAPPYHASVSRPLAAAPTALGQVLDLRTVRARH
jgi:hypothetical protein